MEHNTYGYARVSTREQNEDRQIIALEEFGVPPDSIVCDKQSGKDFERPGISHTTFQNWAKIHNKQTLLCNQTVQMNDCKEM